MTEPTRPEFDILDSEGLEYHRWVSDVEMTFVAKDFSATLKDPSELKDAPSEKVKANALMFLRRHIDPSLRWEYLQLKTPKELWDALKGRFGNIHDTLLPELNAQWNEIRLLDYKRTNDFVKDMLRLKARLIFCDKPITEDDMIQKTLDTSPTSSMILANQYRIEYENKRITTFYKLMNMLQSAEKHNEVLVNNNARPVGTKKIPEANYGKIKHGRHPNEKGPGRANPYPRGNNSNRGKGRGGRGRGRGVSFNVWRRESNDGPSGHTNKKSNASNPHVLKNEPCYRCGVSEHWYKHCRASNKVAACYKKYLRSREHESQYLDEEGNDVDVNLTLAHFTNKGDNVHSMDAPDFD
ncbi:unnamed protein product [Cuscuta campestris]|uniref:CCHC-type domain-containing protein n=1 Tax=Cuscuta campestris TaxID=132261 RepID=A0A484KGC1_9ASTE|nr:unnamed protein product [Cuscuta campestris]